jgi:SAM-dependent methyltransferase
MDINNIKSIQDTVRRKYAEVSQSADGKFAYPTGKSGATALGYSLSVIENIPSTLIDSFCGVGNPFSLGNINVGEVVLDVGCGGGFDLYIASQMVGSLGRVCGIDLTQEMVEHCQRNLMQAGFANSEVQLATSEAIPYDDNNFDVVISNGVLNLSPLKEKSFKEIYRVLRSDGRLQFADIVMQGDLPQASSCSIDAWSQ